MVAWYPKNVLDWRQGTASLSLGEYRVYDVCCEEMYLHEEPIARNERALAGAANLRITDFRRFLESLIALGKIEVTADGKLWNRRVESEVERISNSRRNAAKGGRISGQRRSERASDETETQPNASEANKKDNKNKGKNEPQLAKLRTDAGTDSTRETIKNPVSRETGSKGEKVENLTSQRRKPIEEMTAPERAKLALFERAKALGVSGGLCARLYNAYGGDAVMTEAAKKADEVFAAIERKGKVRDKKAYIGAVISKIGKEDAHAVGELWDRST